MRCNAAGRHDGGPVYSHHPSVDGLASTANGLHVVTWAAFPVTEIAANEHTRVLKGVAFTTGPSTDYTAGTQGLLVLTRVE